MWDQNALQKYQNGDLYVAHVWFYMTQNIDFLKNKKV